MPKSVENIRSVEDFGGRLLATLTETARLLGCDLKTLRVAIAAGQIPVTQFAGGERVAVSWLRSIATGQEQIPPPSSGLTDAARWTRAKQDAIKAKLFGTYGELCACCGTAENPTLDHVNGGGQAQRAEMGEINTYRFYSWLIDNGFPAGYQTLCGPCNSSKGTGPTCRIDHELHSAVFASAPAS